MSGRPHFAAIHWVIPVKAAAVTLADKVAPQQPGPRYFPCPDADAVKRNARAHARALDFIRWNKPERRGRGGAYLHEFSGLYFSVNFH